MAILNSIAGALVVGTLKVGGAAARVGVKAAYGLGDAGVHALSVGEAEWDKQVDLTNATIATCEANGVEAAKRREAMRLARLAAPAQAAPVMAVAGKAAKA